MLLYKKIHNVMSSYMYTVISTHYSLENMFYLYFLYHNAGNYINFSTRRENISIKTLQPWFYCKIIQLITI